VIVGGLKAEPWRNKFRQRALSRGVVGETRPKSCDGSGQDVWSAPKESRDCRRPLPTRSSRSAARSTKLLSR